MLKRSMTMLGALAVAGTLLSAPRPAAAISLDFSPQNQTVFLGSTASVDVVVDPMGSLVGAYDIIVGWDDTIIDLIGVTLDPANDLGLTFNEAFGISPDTSGSNSVNVFDLSLEFDLTGLQDGNDPVTLFNMQFDAIGLGTSPLTFEANIASLITGGEGFLGDENGDLLPTPANDGSITVIDQVARPVPAPATLLLLATGFIALGAARGVGRRRRD